MEKLSDHLHIPTMGEVLRQREAAARAAKPAKRNFAAAKLTRQNKDWTATPYGANWTLYRDLRILRARARSMAQNAPHFRKFLRMAERNVVGHQGIMLQCRAEFGTSGRPNTNLNKQIEREWWEWSFPENASASGKLSLVAAQKLFVRQLIRDGEVLVEHVEADNPFGYALKFRNVDWLDETFNKVLPGGNRVIMSLLTG
jgi:capsid protein